MPEQLPPESHYNPKKLDMIFAILSIVLLLCVIGLFAKDYSRQWKNYQKEFRGLEVEKARVKVDEQNILLTANAEYQEIVKKYDDAKKAVAAQKPAMDQLNKKLAKADAVERSNTQQYQFSKAKYDALKYHYESAASHNDPKSAQIKLDLDSLLVKVNKQRVAVEESHAIVKAVNAEIAEKQKDVKALDKQRFAIAKKKEILEKRLKRTDIAEMSAANQLADMVRDLPIIDLANPNFKIKQIVLKDIPEDVNFMKVPRVDRCTTCHLGIDNPDYKEAAQPFRTHPNLELFMDKNSPHPLDQFACTTCHGGRGRATDFSSAAHTPRDEKQAEEWKKKYGWKPLEHWENPILPVQYTEAGCFKCHQDQGSIKGAEKLNLGMSLIERAGCYGCHNIPKYATWPKTGPDLEFISGKLTKDWAYHWIEDPKSIRPNTWMPSYFNQSNNNDPKSVARGQQEINAMVEYLFANSKPFPTKEPVDTGDAKNGKELVASLGCMACHQVTKEPNKEPRTTASLHQEFGPNLVGLGSKTTKGWLHQWLKNPSLYHSKTRMPSLRLTDKEAADITAYLLEDTTPDAVKPRPQVDEKILNQIVLDFLKKSETLSDAQAKLNAMDVNAKQIFTGQRLIREYGCFSCHTIKGFENDKQIGADLAEEGTKNVHRLDFGFVHIEHSKQAWFKQKLLDPRIFDQGRVLSPLERIKMPNFDFTPAEADAITTVILGMVKERPNTAKMPNTSLKSSFINEGENLIRQLNCQACHIIDGEGGNVKGSVNDWLTKFEGKDATEAKSLTGSFSPPSLLGEGAKVQAQWLFEFLHDPSILRPWVKMRMPSYDYHGGQVNTLVKYFNYLDDQEFPFTDMYHPNLSKEEFAAAEKMFSKEVFGCTQCHVVGSKLPDGSPDSFGPNLALAKRLKPDWIVKWLTNPPAMIPGTKMPVFFDPTSYKDSGPPDILDGDEDRQIRALRDYLLTLTGTSVMPDDVTKAHAAAGVAVKDAEATKK